MEMQVDFNSIVLPHIISVDPNKFREMIAERAYCKAEKREFIGGCEIEDWLEAEGEVKNQCLYWFQEVE